MPQRKSGRPWFTEVFNENYLRGDREANSPEQAKKEVEFLERVLSLKPGSKILDLACGYGRHLVELARRGYVVTGFDINSLFLHEAENDAKLAGVDIELVRGDMQFICFRNQTFDAVINMHTAFGYLETQKDDQEVIRRIYNILRPGGKFVIDVANKEDVVLYLLGQENAREQLEISPEGFSMWCQKIPVYKNGAKKEVLGKIRLYSVSDLTETCEKVGLKPSENYGDFDGGAFISEASKSIILVAIK